MDERRRPDLRARGALASGAARPIPRRGRYGRVRARRRKAAPAAATRPTPPRHGRRTAGRGRRARPRLGVQRDVTRFHFGERELRAAPRRWHASPPA
jgi:hypothetical protein